MPTRLRNSKPKETADKQQTMDDDETAAAGRLTVAYLEATLEKFFNQAEKNSKGRFERLETQLGTIQETLSKHAEDIKAQRTITATLQTRVKNAEDTTSQHSQILNQLENKFVALEDRSRRDNLRLIFLKEGEEKGNALAYLMSNIHKWFPRLTDNPPELMRAHRIGPPRPSSAAPRVMIVKCLRFTDRDRILNESRRTPVEVAGHTVRFAPDYSDCTARRRRPCYPLMNRARGLGYEAFLLYPAVIKLVHGAEQHLFNEPAEAETFLNSLEPTKNSS